MAERVPPGQRDALQKIAEIWLTLAEEQLARESRCLCGLGQWPLLLGNGGRRQHSPGRPSCG